MKRTTWIAAALLLAATIVPAATAQVEGYAEDGATTQVNTGEEERRVAAAGAFTPATVGALSSPDEASAAGMYTVQGHTSSLAGPVDPSVYRVGPGDVMLLQMWGKLTRSIPIGVGPEGTVLVPGGAVIRVAGRTLADVRSEILQRMARQYRDVSMDLRLASPRNFRVYLTGQVRQPGPTLASGAMRVGDVVGRAQLQGDASRRRIELRHTDGTREPCDLDLFLLTGDASLNPWVRDGDIIQVPTATEFVWAQGAVARPGRFEVGVHDSLLDLLHLAGDPLPAAQAERALLVRFRDPFVPESAWVNLQEVYSRTNNPAIVDGERLYVYYLPEYHLLHEAAIMGEVQRPGVYPIREGREHISHLVTAAGGFRPSADLSAIRVHRRSPTANETDLDLDRMLRLSRKDLTATEYEVMRTKLASMGGSFRVDWNRLQADDNLDLMLLDGDSVFVERLVPSIRVDGQVHRPGMLTYVGGRKVRDYLREAGGLTNRAWAGKVRVTRAVTGQTVLARDVSTLDPGDFIWVPEKPDVTVWEQSREILTALAQVATIVIAIKSVQ